MNANTITDDRVQGVVARQLGKFGPTWVAAYGPDLARDIGALLAKERERADELDVFRARQFKMLVEHIVQTERELGVLRAVMRRALDQLHDGGITEALAMEMRECDAAAR